MEMECSLPDYTPPSEEVIEILQKVKEIAIVGLSPNPKRDSHKVALYLLENGYEIIPVNPGHKEILGKPCFKTLKDIPFPVDMANLFINPKRIQEQVDQAIELGIPAIWMQLGIVDNESAHKARKQGIQVVMNMCIMREHQKLVMPKM